MAVIIGRDGPRRHNPKAGGFGLFAVVVFGLACVVAVFLAAYFWLDGDAAFAAMLGIGSLAIPVTFGFFAAEVFDQRVGALAFVLAAGVVAGAAGASAWYERDDFLDRRDLDRRDFGLSEDQEPTGTAPGIGTEAPSP